MKKLKQIPTFHSPIEESNFWEVHDSADYIDWSTAKEGHFPELKPSTKTISLRLPEDLLYEIKMLANKDDIPYQSLIKILLAKHVRLMTNSYTQ